MLTRGSKLSSYKKGDVGMLFEERKFFEEDLDLTIPELKAAAELYAKGERDAAVKQTVAYIKSVIDPEKYLTIPYDLTVSGKYEGKSINSIDIADLSLEGKFSSVGVWIDFGKDKPIDWFANPCYNKYREWGASVPSPSLLERACRGVQTDR